MTLHLMAVRQEVNNYEIFVVVKELEFAMNLALYGLLTTRSIITTCYILDLYICILTVCARNDFGRPLFQSDSFLAHAFLYCRLESGHL